MSWFILTLACIVLWGITDILYKASWDYNDPLSHHKTFVWIGIIMALAGCIMANWSDTLLTSIINIKDNLYLMPLNIAYALALFFGLLGKKHLDASVVSPLENIEGPLEVIILYVLFLITGNSSLIKKFGVVQIIATVAIVIGVILLAIQEHKLSKQESQLGDHKKKHRLGALALIFPLVYTLVDATSMVAVSISLSEKTETSIPDIDFFIIECAGFALVAICVWLYMFIVKKHAYNPFQEEELVRCGAATGETFGTMTFILASAINPRLTAPVTSLYCLVTIVLARIFLKERLNKKQYVALAFLVIGIALIGIFDIFNFNA